MAKIIERIERVEKTMNDPAKKTGLANLLKNAAIDAIMEGIGSKEWITYMSMFADSKQQLDRLTVPKAGEDTWLRESRAYMVSNPICTINTNTQTGKGVRRDEIDAPGASTAEDPAVVALRPPDFVNFIP